MSDKHLLRIKLPNFIWVVAFITSLEKSKSVGQTICDKSIMVAQNRQKQNFGMNCFFGPQKASFIIRRILQVIY